MDILTGNWWNNLKHLDYTPHGVDFNCLETRLAVQVIFVLTFYTGLADVLSPLIQVGINSFEVGHIDTTDITDHMGQKLPVGIHALQAGFHGDTGQPRLQLGQFGHFHGCQIRFDQNRIE